MAITAARRKVLWDGTSAAYNAINISTPQLSLHPAAHGRKHRFVHMHSYVSKWCRGVVESGQRTETSEANNNVRGCLKQPRLWKCRAANKRVLLRWRDGRCRHKASIFFQGVPLHLSFNLPEQQYNLHLICTLFWGSTMKGIALQTPWSI